MSDIGHEYIDHQRWSRECPDRNIIMSQCSQTNNRGQPTIKKVFASY